MALLAAVATAGVEADAVAAPANRHGVPSTPAGAAPFHSFAYLTTGNGHGFQTYDERARRIMSFLEHPYRFLGPGADAKADGVLRRNLAADFHFGVSGPGGFAWTTEPEWSGPIEYLDQANILHAPMRIVGVDAHAYYAAPFGYEGNAMIAWMHAPGATATYPVFDFHMGNPTVEGGVPRRDRPDARGEALRPVAAVSTMSAGALVETGPGGGAMIYLPLGPVAVADCQGVVDKLSSGKPLTAATTCGGDDIVPALQLPVGADGWSAVAMAFVENAADADAEAARLAAWVGGRAPAALFEKHNVYLHKTYV